MKIEQKLTRIEQKYKDEIVAKLQSRFGFKNPMQVPRLQKCVVNMGVGRASEDIKLLEDAAKDLGLITGQKPVYRRAKKSVSNFKIREDMPIGCCVTLRGKRMYEFVDRLINTALPRIRDFRGVNSRSFDKQGNFSLGIKEQTIFPEVLTDRISRVQGMDVTIVTSAKSKEEALHLLFHLGMPFRGKNEVMTLEELN